MSQLLRVSAVWSVVLAFGAQFAIAVDLDSLVRAHDSTIRLVGPIDMQIDVYRTHYSGQQLAHELQLATWRWSRTPQLDRQRWTQLVGYAPNRDGLPQNIGDLIEDENQFKALRNWDPANPQVIEVLRQGSIRAWFAPRQPWTPSPFPNPAGQFGLFHIQANLQDARRPLVDLVRESREARVLGERTVSGHSTWCISVEHPDTGVGGEFAGTIFEIYLDPSVGHMVRKLVAHIADVDPSPDKIVPARIEREVTKFLTIGNGTHVPVGMIATLYDAKDNSIASRQRLDASRVTFDGAVPSDAFDFRFPANARVTEMPAIDGKFTMHIWGPDNRPVDEVRDVSQLAKFREVPDLEPRISVARLVFIGVNIIVVFILSVFLLRRRFLRNRVGD